MRRGFRADAVVSEWVSPKTFGISLQSAFSQGEVRSENSQCSRPESRQRGAKSGLSMVDIAVDR